MKIDIITLFPNMFTGFVNESIMSRAIKKGIVEINVVNLRDYSTLKNKRVDDTNIAFTTTNSTSITFTNCKIIIEYTKTTD